MLKQERLERLARLTRQAGDLAHQLTATDDNPCRGRQNGECCIVNEDMRPLTAAERDAGSTTRAFRDYDHQRLCLPCRAYWFAEAAHKTLIDLHSLELKYGSN